MKKRGVRLALVGGMASTSLVFFVTSVFYLLFVWTTGTDFFSSIVLRSVTMVQPAPNQTTPAKGRLILQKERIDQLRKGQQTTVSGQELLKLKKRPPGFLFVSIVPDDLQGLQFDDQFVLMRRFTDAAIRLKADAIVDASIGDQLHTYPAGMEMAKELRQHGIKRFVIFDGGHHVAGLPLEPDCMLVPVTNWQGEQFLDHGFTRDAIKVSDLRAVMKKEQIDSYIALFPRLGIGVKTPSAMSGLAKQAIIAANRENIKPTIKPIDATRAVGRSVERRGVVFTSSEMSGDEDSSLATQRARSLITLAANGTKPKRIYLGITVGISSYLNLSGPPIDKASDIEDKLKSALTSLSVLSQPFSGKDIYARKLFRWE